MADLNLVVVTPEKTVIDRTVASIRVPMFDGSAGVYPRRAPVVGRLGIGELRINGNDGSSESYFIDGGFIQVKGEQVSVLTSSVQPLSEIDRTKAQADLGAAIAEQAVGDEELAALMHRQERARKLVSLSAGS
ncbi:MAG: ATP synthase F1 subunit epsilon [Fuerstiella sp.]|nr:ATP synthase F1 subunit epsilon [Fuerstiella sp.]